MPDNQSSVSWRKSTIVTPQQTRINPNPLSSVSDDGFGFQLHAPVYADEFHFIVDEAGVDGAKSDAAPARLDGAGVTLPEPAFGLDAEVVEAAYELVVRLELCSYFEVFHLGNYNLAK